MGYDDNGNWIGINQQSDKQANLDAWHREEERKKSNANNSGNGCMVLFFVFAGGLLASTYGIYQLFC